MAVDAEIWIDAERGWTVVTDLTRFWLWEASVPEKTLRLDSAESLAEANLTLNENCTGASGTAFEYDGSIYNLTMTLIE